MLNTTPLGDRGPRIAFLHGLFGQGKNWTTIGKQLAADGYRVTLVDMPDHGRSPWTEEFSYVCMADAVVDALRSIGGEERWTVVGHSMGGKAAMLVALRHAELVERLVVVDISPVAYEGLTSFGRYIEGMSSMPLSSLTSRADADSHMKPFAEDPTVRAFLLQNLRREGDSFRWQMNLDLLARSLPLIGGWPAESVVGRTYDGPVLWVAGGESSYVTTEYVDAMRELFPRVRLVTVKGAGHWVHSQKPGVFLEAMRAFLG